MIKYIDQIDITAKKVLIRTDFNVPMNEKGDITDDTRIRACLPTIMYALAQNAKVIILSHMGRPKGERIEKLSLKPVAGRLSEILGKNVDFVDDCIGDNVKAKIEELTAGNVLLLENARYHIGETKNNSDFVKSLSELADVYINDAFSASHREHASVFGITPLVKEIAGGLLMKKELTSLNRVFEDPLRPMVAILGGAKVSTKIGTIENILPKVEKLIIGGAMANTFLGAMGVNVGDSLVEPDFYETATNILKKAKEMNRNIYLPVDCIIAPEMTQDAPTKMIPVQEVTSGWKIFDIGFASLNLFAEALQDAKTILWNGPVGAFEIDNFAMGTIRLSHAVVSNYAFSVVGGGDTVAAIKMAKDENLISYISTGGGAFLEYLEGKELPGIKALDK
jgi:phosphoglycerate kinase